MLIAANSTNFNRSFHSPGRPDWKSQPHHYCHFVLYAHSSMNENESYYLGMYAGHFTVHTSGGRGRDPGGLRWCQDLVRCQSELADKASKLRPAARRRWRRGPVGQGDKNRRQK